MARISMLSRRLSLATLAVLALLPGAGIRAQTAMRIEADPPSLVIQRGQSATLSVRVLDDLGRAVDEAVRMVGARRALSLDDNTIIGLEVGEWEVIVTTVRPGPSGEPLRLVVPVVVEWPPVVRVEVTSPGPVYEGSTVTHRAIALHADGTERPGVEFVWRTSDPARAEVDAFGHVRGTAAGPVQVEAAFEGVTGRIEHTVREFVGTRLEIVGGGEGVVRTGDVQTFAAVVLDAAGNEVPNAPVEWSHAYVPAQRVMAPPAPGQMEDGRIVADVPGEFTVVARSGGLRATRTFEAVQREVVRSVEIVGRGRQERVYSTDFWVFEGVDGRDYALVGAKQSDGHAFVFDVTDPENVVKTDSVQVDARSVNDVKVSPDGRYASLTREGASNRRNGVVILDLADPAHPVIASEYTDGLTGGVHNAFPTNDHLFALSNGDKYVILDVSDIYNPRYVSEYDHPNSRVHDVWVHDGIAYSAEWGTGLVAVDVGNGRWGGTIEEPVFVTNYPVPTGATHAVFPYYSESAGKFYVFIGDEILTREGMAWEGVGPDFRQKYDPETGRGGYPRASWGYIQVIDFDDPESPKMVARYEVSEFGTHNIWVANDILYQAYYEGGMRLVDVSGELMGNLYTQGREVSVYKAFDPVGFIPNSPGAWSVMPHRDLVWFADINSGLWALRLAESP
ncbi:MAG: hypothetical protein OXE96_00530 [Gemmatimonadetes bacterium]|nr:hypothetical protein [Gemmatimonadota bacterium]